MRIFLKIWILPWSLLSILELRSLKFLEQHWFLSHFVYHRELTRFNGSTLICFPLFHFASPLKQFASSLEQFASPLKQSAKKNLMAWLIDLLKARSLSSQSAAFVHRSPSLPPYQLQIPKHLFNCNSFHLHFLPHPSSKHSPNHFIQYLPHFKVQTQNYCPDK